MAISTMIGPLVFLALLSLFTHHPLPVQAGNSSITSLQGMTDLIHSLVVENRRKATSVTVTKTFREALLERGYGACFNREVCSKECHLPFEESASVPQLSFFCESGRCGLNSDSVPTCGLGEPSNCRDGQACFSTCEDAELVRARNKADRDKIFEKLGDEGVELYIQSLKEVAHDPDINFKKFCSSGKCSFKDMALVCGCCDEDKLSKCKGGQVCSSSCEDSDSIIKSTSETEKQSKRDEVKNRPYPAEYLDILGSNYCKSGKCYSKDGWLDTCENIGLRQASINIFIILLIQLTAAILI